MKKKSKERRIFRRCKKDIMSNEVHPSAVVDSTVKLADNVVVGANCVVGRRTKIDQGTRLEANVTIDSDVTIGKNNHFFPSCTVGGQPQLLGLDPDEKLGGLVIGDNNTIREQVTIHPSMHPGKFTRIGNDNLLMIGVHIGHDCVLEDKIVMSNYAQISGHCKIETGVWLSGMVLLHQFITIGKWCYAAGMAGINHDIPPFMIVSGHYPPKVRGVNKRGLSRAGLNEEQQTEIVKAYKKLYRGDGTLLEKTKAMAAQDGLDENVAAIVEAIIKSNEHRFGRYLESFRH